MTKYNEIFEKNKKWIARMKATDEEERYNRLVELNVEQQCINVIKTAVIQEIYNLEA